ncbi:MAG: SDR family oxidoreductase [Candidatus Schekmanbacteria bacterium]|nr:MAG: SDR family oxidoreductase [Candidatus Schekmanbacteria bacterium]
MKSVVITGSTKGIGLGLALEFLKRGCSVVISGRNKNKLTEEVARAEKKFGTDKVLGKTCDVCNILQVQDLWDSAKAKFGKVDIWINNAGRDTSMVMLWELDPEEIYATINTNITGLIFGTKIALKGMIEQGGGQIYNMEGFGSSDMMRPGMTVYGTTKRAVRYFTESVIEEAKDTPVQIGTLGPGMVVTDFMLNGLRKMSPEKLAEVKPIYNMLADKVETVTPFLVEEILKNNKTGAKIDWLTNEKAMERMNSEEYINRDLLGEFGF